MILKQNVAVRIVGLVLVMVGSLMLVNNTSAVHTLTLTSSGPQSIDISPASSTAISSDSINVATTCRYGYNFTIQTSVEDNNLYQDGDWESPAYTVFYPADVTTPLDEVEENTWGYFYDDDSSIVPTSADNFRPVPSLLDEPDLIKTTLDNPASSDINDSFNIYYGVSVRYDAEKGIYKMIPDEHDNDGTIVYTVTMPESCVQYTVQFSPTSIFEGNIVSGTGTMDDQIIYDGITTALDDMDFTAPSGYYFTGWNTAQDGSGTQYTDGQQVTDITTAGTTITLYAQWTDCAPNHVCYSPNVSNPNDVEGEMDSQQLRYFETEFAIHASNYSRTNYGFAGWNTRPDGTGTYYGPNQSFEYDISGAKNIPGLKLYAQWVASAGNMQNWSGCSSMSIGDVTALKDTRDDDVYAVAKLADGKCWMIENLRLDNTAAHNSDGTLAQGYGSNFVGLANPETPADFSQNNLAANSLYSTDGSTAVTISGDYQSYRFPRYNNVNTSSRYSGTSDYLGDNNTYSYGNYYTWAAVIADTTHYNTNNQSITTTSICPTGWHVPRGGDNQNTANNEYLALGVALTGALPTNYSSQNYGYTGDPEGINASRLFRSYPNNFLFSGSVYATSLFARGNYGYYWSSTIGDFYGIMAYEFNIAPSGLVPGNFDSSNVVGHTIRCIAGT